jgi:hypothetical protein
MRQKSTPEVSAMSFPPFRLRTLGKVGSVAALVAVVRLFQQNPGITVKFATSTEGDLWGRHRKGRLHPFQRAFNVIVIG